MEHTDLVTKRDRHRDKELLDMLAAAEEQLQRRPRPNEPEPKPQQNQSPWDARDIL